VIRLVFNGILTSPAASCSMPTAVFLFTGNNDRIAIGVVPGRPGAFLADLDFLS
jgi:hypothetical protein